MSELSVGLKHIRKEMNQQRRCGQQTHTPNANRMRKRHATAMAHPPPSPCRPTCGCRVPSLSVEEDRFPHSLEFALKSTEKLKADDWRRTYTSALVSWPSHYQLVNWIFLCFRIAICYYNIHTTICYRR